MKNVTDLRSDTVTRPTAAMRKAMADAEVGDDVFREDPSVNELEEYSAHLLGKEAALFVPSGTMGNLLAMLSLVPRGQEVIMHEQAHIFHHELSGVSAIVGAKPVTLPGSSGIFSVADLHAHYHPGEECFDEKTGLITIENTHNFCGGTFWSQEALEHVARFAKEAHIPVHMDGARLFNAVIASGMSAKKIASYAHSVTFCLSKGLGCPVGSVLCASHETIDKARRWRKMLGAGMRQAGILAAAGLHALKYHCERLAEDHYHAQLLAQAARVSGQFIQVQDPQTNILFLQCRDEAAAVRHRLETQGILCFATGRNTLRLVTHLDVDNEAIMRVCKVLESL